MLLTNALWLLPLAWLWLVLINDLRVEWTVNPQYSYGWAVPFLCAFLVWQRIQKNRKQKAESRNTGPSFQLSKFQLFALALCALLYTPTRLIEEANPGWRLVSWALAIEVAGLTLLAVYFAATVRSAERGVRSVPPSSLSAFQHFSISDFVFPVCFFFVAVPWPSLIEQPLIQGLTRWTPVPPPNCLAGLAFPPCRTATSLR